MISTSSTRVLRSNNYNLAPAGPVPTRPGRWRSLLALLAGAGALVASACTNSVTDIGVGLPDANTNTGAYLIDTLTIRASTVLRDSVITSSSSNLLVGTTTDPLLGTLTARSIVRLSSPDGYRPDPTFVYDSLVLVLKPSGYRYGDTTKTQALVEVHVLDPKTPISATRPSYASPKLTAVAYDQALLNKGPLPFKRVRANLTSLRLPLKDAYGQALLANGQLGKLTTQDDFDAYLPGLVLTPTAGDNAALLGLSATAADAAMVLYYHDPINSTVALNSSFSIAGGNRHFFQVDVSRNGSVSKLPTVSLQSVSAASTGERTYIEGVLGLQTKLDFPYLTDIQQFGNNLTITSATVIASVPNETLTPLVPLPPSIIVSTSDINNRPVAVYNPKVDYVTGLSLQTGLDQGQYQWSIAAYCQAVLARTVPNNGLLLSSFTPDLPSRVVLGSPRNVQNKLQLRLYFIRVQ